LIKYKSRSLRKPSQYGHSKEEARREEEKRKKEDALSRNLERPPEQNQSIPELAETNEERREQGRDIEPNPNTYTFLVWSSHR